MDAKAGKQDTKTKVPRLYHKKSRNGCERCRARHVKCDEKQPVCGSCSRHSVPCIYNKRSSAPMKSSRESYRSSTASIPMRKPNLLPNCTISAGRPEPGSSTMGDGFLLSSEYTESDVFDIPESRSRRLLELHLLENFISNTCLGFPACHNPEVKHVWTVEVPRMAMDHDNLLYGIFAVSALQLLRADSENKELIAARHNYFGLWLREHRKAVAQLCSKSAEALCYASTLVLIDAFASLQDRLLEPYGPPMEWLNMVRGAGAIFKTSLGSVGSYETTGIMKIVNAQPQLYDFNVIFAESNRKGLLGLLSQDVAAGQEVWNDETREAYEKTLSYIGSVQIGLKNGEHQLAVCRRMMAFANFVPEKFLDFVEEQRPRALAILAHFFALTAGLENLWWIRDTARREIGGLQKVLPAEWQELIRFPVGVVMLKPR